MFDRLLLGRELYNKKVSYKLVYIRIKRLFVFYISLINMLYYFLLLKYVDLL